MKRIHLATLALTIATCVTAQEPVKIGRASYAAYPPAYKAATDEHSGFNATRMLTRHIYADEIGPDGNPRPIPTNDWWTDLLNNQFSGAMWSYPAMINTSAEGVSVHFPSYWYENGTEVKSKSWIRVGGENFTATEARATDWHDWDVEVALPGNDGSAIMATLVHGSPFTWFEFDGVAPIVVTSARTEFIAKKPGATLLKIGTDLYGLYYPTGTEPEFTTDGIALGDAGWLSVGLLTSESDFEEFEPYATSVVRSTRVDWNYDEKASRLSTTWTVDAENLRTPGTDAPVMQGFLPHMYKHATGSDIAYTGKEYLSPRGQLRMATAADGRFNCSYTFHGMLPAYPVPVAGENGSAGYNPEVMKDLIDRYAASGSFGADTYWGGKGLVQMALNMNFARLTDNNEAYETSRKRLREALVDWLTYTPGEQQRFFAYYPRWGGMLGFDVSYDSDAFNDHHFHYGYFIYAAALLCMEDESFRDGYGEILRMIAKDYANYDRNDTRFPFLRTLDPWAGHSYAGGLGDHGNDNGNGQESSSEAMQSWGAMYLLGVALDDREMRDAGIFGWITESRGTVEYWFDRDHIHPGRDHNYNYDLYQSPYNTNLTSKGIGWWTWFSGDPLWMHSIQWMPVSPCLNYLSEDLDFVKWDYEKMRSGTAYSWFEPSGNEAPLAAQSVGNVVLCYLERYDPAEAARIFDEALARGMGIARGIDTGHISYFVIHSHLTYGDPDFTLTADCPTANAYRAADGTMTYVAYNPGTSDRTVTFYRDGVAERSIKVPAGRITAVSDVPEASVLAITSPDGDILPPGHKVKLAATLFDQYGAEILASTTWSVSSSATIDSEGNLTIAANALKGSKLTVTARCTGLEAAKTFTVNDLPVAVSAAITGLPDFVEIGIPCTLQYTVTNQYNETISPETSWKITDAAGNPVEIDGNSFTPARPGNYTLTATGGGTTATASLTVLPVLPNVALGKKATSSSEENVGTVTANATDGDHSTRWGSAHSDNQWLMVDLGEDYLITSVTIDWEAAYALDYDIEVASAADSNNFTTVLEQRSLSAPGVVRHPLAASGRYVRIKCLRRATNYGFSILELEVGGIRADASTSTLAGIFIDAPQLMKQGETTSLEARGVNAAGHETNIGQINWTADREATFQGNDFTPAGYGLYTVTATASGLSATAQILVEEATRLGSLSVTPATLTLLTGDTKTLNIEGLNQFGGIYPVEASTIEVKVYDAEGRLVTPETAIYDPATTSFTAYKSGDYTIDFAGMATVKASVRDITEANLAAGKPARASSAVEGNDANKVTDTDGSTRWESLREDNQWIEVDLEETFVVNRVVIRWEAAYATAFSISTETAGSHATVYADTDFNGGVSDIELPGVPASKIRIDCIKRATEWGFSIYEVEVYGTSRFTATDNGEAPVIESMKLTGGNGSIRCDVKASHSSGIVFTTVNVFDSSDNFIATQQAYGTESSVTFSDLITGKYTVVAVVSDSWGNTTSEEKDININFSIEGLNLALNKPVEATSSENVSLKPEMAIDGNLDTRWGSLFNDNEAITVDLGAIFLIDNVRIFWNNPAFATHYNVEVSIEGDEYTEIHSRAGWDGKTDDVTFSPVEARFVRVTGLKRATPYGTSINELEVYGLQQLTTGVAEIESEDTTYDVYSLQGFKLRSSITRAEARATLAPGVYILVSPTASYKISL